MKNQELEKPKNKIVYKKVSKSFFNGAITFWRTIQYTVDGAIISYRKPQKVDTPNIEDQMRLFVNRIIDRVFDDRKRGIYH